MKGLDTNVLMRFILSDNERQAKRAEQYITTHCTRDSPCYINRIVLCESVWVLESAYGYSRAQIAELLEYLLRTAEFSIEDSNAAWRALAEYKTKKVDFSDALMGHVNKLHHCEDTATFDKWAGMLENFVMLE